jgi:N-methylhydantoinase A
LRLALHVTALRASVLTLGAGEPHLSDQGEIGMDDHQPFSGWPLALPAASLTPLGKGPSLRVAARMESLALGERLPEPSTTLADALAVAGWTADTDGAAERLQAAVAQPLGLELGEAATTTLEVAVATFAETTRLRLIDEGVAPHAATLIAVGVWAPLLAPSVAFHLQCQRLIVPVEASASSAIGAALATIGLEQVATAQLDFNSTHSAKLESLFARLANTAQKATGLVGAKEERKIKLRVHGTGIELFCALPAGPLDPVAMEVARREFVARFRSQHPDHPLDPQASLKVTAVRLRLVGPDSRRLPGECAVHATSVRDRRMRFSNGEVTTVRAIGWSDLPPSGVIDGPLVVILNGSELVLPPGCCVSRHSGSTLAITRREGF